ncbi:MAG: ABC transporter substrate-binding protein [Anaerolineae bacterium]
MALRYLFRIFFLTLVISLVGCAPETPTLPVAGVPTSQEPSRPLRLFLVRSYGTEDIWGQQIRAGVLETLSRNGYDRVEGNLVLTEFTLNAERYTGAEVNEAVLSTVLNAIESSLPHVVLVADDEAARSVIPNYPDPEQIFVYCGLNGDPEAYGITGDNITGVLERPYPVQTVRMAQDLGNQVTQVLIMSDTSLSGKASAEDIYEILNAPDAPPVEVVREATGEWETWQRVVREEFGKVDGVLMGQHAGLLNEAGETVPEDEVLAYTLENSPVPVFGLWLGDVQRGAAGGLTISPYEQGRAAADLVVRIARGEAPSALAPTLPERNVLAVNIAAVERWSLNVPLELLVSARVYRRFPAP